VGSLSHLAGHDCAHWSDLGPGDTPDNAICEFARAHGFVLITNDLDFPQILAFTREAKPSVILLRGEPLTPEVRGATLLNAIVQSEGELQSGAVLTVDWSDRVRARLLPLK
jgi:predicted nuclease of predicted toxin-antitoxin system